MELYPIARRLLWTSAIFFCWLALFAASAQAAAEPLVSMNFSNAEVREVLTALSAIGHVNIIMDDSVSGKITVQLTGVSVETVLQLVTKTKGLVYQKLDNVIVVGTPDQMSKGFGSVHVYPLQYAKAVDVLELAEVTLTNNGNSRSGAGSGRDDGHGKAGKESKEAGETKESLAGQSAAQDAATAHLKVDEATNSLVFFGSDADAAHIRQIVETVDVPCRQVLLEAQVMSINKDAIKDLGLEWNWSELPRYPVREEPEYNDNGTVKNPGRIVRKPLDSGGDVGGIIQFGRGPEGVPYEFYYQAKLNALITNGRASVLAKPNVAAINGKEATINIGEEVPVPVVATAANGTTTTSVEYKKVGIILRCVPRANANGYITATIHTEVSSPIFVPEMKAYKIVTRSADTEVRLKDGEVMAIGGLIGKEENHSVKEVPFLSKLPLIGALFKDVHDGNSETEVIIFLKAKIVP